jgi:Glycosyl hydrolases family 38 N-terminal domain
VRNRSVFSSTVALPESRIPDVPRRELTRGTTGVDFERGGISVRAGDLPLLRRAEDGSLLQCLRLVIRSGEEHGPVLVTAVAGGHEDSQTVTIAGGERAVRLFVPEVRRPERVLVRIEADGLHLEEHVELRPQRRWRIFLIHHSHLDIGYTDPQARVLAHHLSYLDSAVDYADATEGWPDASRFRWNVEANWPLQRWLAVRPVSAKARFLELVRQGLIEVAALPFTMHLEALSVDELSRQLAFADELRERHEVDVVTAMQTDVPGATACLPGLLADAGVRYLDVAHNWADRGAPYLNGGERLTRPFRWRSESGKEVLVWYTDSPHGVAYLEGNMLGLADSYDMAFELLPEYLGALATRPYPYGQSSSALGLPELDLVREPYPYDILHLRVQGMLADNAGPSLAPAEIARAWNEQWAFPELRLATNREFFETAEERLGDGLETYAGDWTDWWADGLGSAARPLALNRRAQATTRTAQTLHVLADRLEDEPVADWAADVERAYESMALFDEHTWGAADPSGNDLAGRGSGTLQWQAKAALAADSNDRSEALEEAAASRMAQLAHAPAGTLASLVVFNPSSWSRTDVVRVFVPSSRLSHDGPFALVDEATGHRVPHAVELQAGPSNRNRPRGTSVSFVAAEIPSLGYRRFSLVDADGGEGSEARTPDPLVLENEHYLVEIDQADGVAVRLVDKALTLDLVDGGSPFGFNQYVYDRHTSMLRATERLPARGGPAVNGPAHMPAAAAALLAARTTAEHGVVVGRTSNAVEDRITLRLVADGVEWLETSFRLLRGLRRLDIVNRLGKVPTPEKESVYFAFPFALDAPRVQYELTGAVGSPDAHVPGSAGHLQVIRHWVTLEDSSATVAWGTREAPLVELGSIALPYPPYPETVAARSGTVFSWVMNNVWDTNFPVEQAGEATFVYAVSSAPPDAKARELGLRTGAAVARPLVGILAASRGAPRLAVSGSFCTVDRSDVEVVTLAPSRRGHDFVVLLQSCAPEECEVRVAFPDLPVERILAGTFLERDLHDVTRDGEAQVRIGPGDLVALAVDVDRA